MGVRNPRQYKGVRTGGGAPGLLSPIIQRNQSEETSLVVKVKFVIFITVGRFGRFGRFHCSSCFKLPHTVSPAERSRPGLFKPVSRVFTSTSRRLSTLTSGVHAALSSTVLTSVDASSQLDEDRLFEHVSPQSRNTRPSLETDPYQPKPIGSTDDPVSVSIAVVDEVNLLTLLFTVV